MNKILLYNGNGFISGVPAMDLTEDDIRASGYTAEQLLAFGCYTRATQYQPAPDTLPGEGAAERVILIKPADGISDEEARGAGQALRQRRTEQEKK